MPKNAIWDLKQDLYGAQDSMFNKISWEQRKDILYQPINLEALSKIFPFLKDITKYQKRADDFAAYASDFNNKTLDTIRGYIDPNYTFEEGHWLADVIEDNNGRIAIQNVQVQQADNGMNHYHNVFKSVNFRDISILLQFKKNDGSLYEKRLYLDITSSNNNIPLPQGDSHIHRAAGTRGSLDEDDNFQIGIRQDMVYAIQCGNKVIYIIIDFSFSFRYPINDFEPFGVINASAIYPQIKFSSITYNILDYPNLVIGPVNNISSSLPSDVIKESAEIKKYNARIKMIVNNDSSHHVNIDGSGHDQNYLSSLRSTNNIPSMFEKIFLRSGTGGNTVGFYADSNYGQEDENGSSDDRYKPVYNFNPASGISDPSPYWQNIFDYANYDLKTEKEFIAVYGKQNASKYSISENKFQDGGILSSNYPIGQSKSLTVQKKKRQGAYDNIHLHGYLGNYGDRDPTKDDKLVIHAPICGYCCFHMHWRWSDFNSEVAKSRTVKGAAQIMAEQRLNLDDFKFLGWGSSENYPATIRSNVTAGAPLIPPNQELKIAVTHPNATPHDEINQVIPTNGGLNTLDANEKAVWYSADILNEGFFESHVVLEQGCGYAFSYSKIADVGADVIAGGVARGLPGFLREVLENDLGITDNVFLNDLYSEYVIQSPYPPFLSMTMGITSFSTAEIFELQYRLMRYFNTGPYANYDQVLVDDNNPNGTPQATNLSGVENL